MNKILYRSISPETLMWDCKYYTEGTGEITEAEALILKRSIRLSIGTRSTENYWSNTKDEPNQRRVMIRIFFEIYFRCRNDLV